MPAADENKEIQALVLRLNGRAWGMSLGLVCGVGLFLATNYLVWKGGLFPGKHLQLLKVFFPGYSVSFPGSIVGFIYAFVVGYALGRLIGTAYNRLVARTS